MKRFIQRRKYPLVIILLLGVWFWNCLPDPLFVAPTSTVVENADGLLLGARIASDGQWRFPQSDSVPEKFKTAIMLFEDEYFEKHPGVNPVSMMRAMKQNLQEQRVVSGGSTITMQTIRLARQGKGRTIGEKLIEVTLALRLEIRCSKDEILNLYASYAPFGGNVVGLDAAAWRYYGRAAHQLSWGEICTLAVLPNAPGLIYPGRNQEKLRAKRNRLIDKLHRKGHIDKFTCNLSKDEGLPQKPKVLPNETPHLLVRLENERGKGLRSVTSIDHTLQNNLSDLLERHHATLKQNLIDNAAILVLDVKNDQVLAYVGNTDCDGADCGGDVDIITAPRSTGSILKPFLYAAAIDDGLILPSSLLADVPTDIAGFTPKNFDLNYDGAVHADNALIRSLNVPAVRLLRSYGLERFHQKLQDLRIRHISRSPTHYGLSLILGGAEASLWDICRSFTGMARSLNRIRERDWRYDASDFLDPAFLADQVNNPLDEAQSTFSAGSIWKTFEVMTALNRPHQEGQWEHFSTSRRIAWKTGTSFGHRDAWAVGVTPEYVIGVWVGNADGEGRYGLTGLNSAAPILFDAFDKLPASTWFEPPFEELAEVTICTKSGNRIGPHCEEHRAELVPERGLNGPICTYHRLVHLDKNKKERVNSACYDVSAIQSKNWFVLPPRMELYYRHKDPTYQNLPPLAQACTVDEQPIALIYPKGTRKLFVPRDIGGELSRVVFEFAHRQEGAQLHWHLDEQYIGTTDLKHKKGLLASAGPHTLTVVDQQGNSHSTPFELVDQQ
jgi:penicillin-binding protein 1C